MKQVQPFNPPFYFHLFVYAFARISSSLYALVLENLGILDDTIGTTQMNGMGWVLWMIYFAVSLFGSYQLTKAAYIQMQTEEKQRMGIKHIAILMLAPPVYGAFRVLQWMRSKTT
jgi:CRISPR/Cas system CSM-associated protein Csm3 (group 7 of RAMP superfamily)